MNKSFGKVILVLILFFLILGQGLGKDPGAPSQTVKGRVINFQSQQPVPGATVSVSGSNLGAYTKTDGSFKIENVPVGRHKLRISAIGYEAQIQNIVLTSGKQLQLKIQLNESIIEMEGIEVTGSRGNFQPINEAAIVSSNLFTIDDVQRFAGSRMDPARMAQNYAGVVGADDQRNDIIIRGGSPTELLWRLDGLDLPNPNHFATQGATGGPVNAINSMLLDNSDFFTGAFPAGYGNKISGVFDLRTRRGNDENYEFLGQMGFNGFELGAEGPVPGADGSFIANYRYSFLDFLNTLGFDFSFAGIPRYQDAMLKGDFEPAKGHYISVTSLWGTSGIDMQRSDDNDVETDDEDLFNGTDLFSLGIRWKHLLSDKLYGRLLFGTVYQNYFTEIDSLTTDGNHNVTAIDRWYEQDSDEGYYNIKYDLNWSPSARHFISIGTEARLEYYNLNEKRFPGDNDTRDLKFIDEEGKAWRFQNFINWNWRLSKRLTLDLGLQNQYLEINSKATIEPRLAASWNFAERHSLNAGFGLFSQSPPISVMFTKPENNDLDFIKSIHYVLGYSYQPFVNAIIKLEGYYKDISGAPVRDDANSYYSFLNEGTNFGMVGQNNYFLASDGTGRAYGADFSLLKNFSDGYYITATASYIRQQYTGSDGVRRFGAFDNIFVMNLLAGYEIVVSESFTIELSGKYIIAGGQPYTPIDLGESIRYGSTEYDEDNPFSKRKPDYSKFDFKLDFRNNLEGVSIISYLSIENAFNRDNVLMYTYDSRDKAIETVMQPGFFFVGGVRVEF